MKNILSFAGPKFTMSVKTGSVPYVRGHAYWKLEEPVRNLDAWRLYIIQRRGKSCPRTVLFFFLQNSLFDLITRCSRFYHKFPGFFNDSEIHFLIHKIHLEKSHFFWSFPRPFYLETCQHLSYVCGGFNKNKSPQNLLLFINRVTRTSLVGRLFFFLKKKMLVAPAPLTILTKPIVRLRCRCSCEMCRTSAVPLLVILETALKSS